MYFLYGSEDVSAKIFKDIWGLKYKDTGLRYRVKSKSTLKEYDPLIQNYIDQTNSES
jgi:hypothetical protein